jgi:poly(A) polymerase
MPDPSAQRDFALETVNRLRAAGFEALWAGGCVRDQLLGRTPKDYDVATNATPEQIRDLFGRRRTLAIGAAFGVVTVLGPRAAGQLDVVTFRSDATYSDGRHPDSVTFTTAQEDAARRDFTINGLFYDPVGGQVVDYVDGQKDIQRRVIRAIGDPCSRIREDKLRMLRAVRFAAAYEFGIDPETLSAIQEMAAEVTTVSAERIGAEVRRMLLDARRAVAIDLLCRSKLISHVLPEIASLDDVTRREVMRRLAALREPTISLVVATLFSGGLDSPTIAAEPVLAAQTFGRRLRFTNREIERVAWLLSHAPDVAIAHQLPWPKLQRLLVNEGARELVALRESIAGPDHVALRYCRERLAWPMERLNPLPLLDGAALIAHGLEPGPQFSDLIEKTRDAQLNGEINTREQALALVDRLR